MDARRVGGSAGVSTWPAAVVMAAGYVAWGWLGGVRAGLGAFVLAVLLFKLLLWPVASAAQAWPVARQRLVLLGIVAAFLGLLGLLLFVP